jgi:hypothetical protein
MMPRTPHSCFASLYMAMLVAVAGCGQDQRCDPTACPSDEPEFIASHHRSSFADADDFLAYALDAGRGGALKFVIPGMDHGGCRVDFLDPRFYALHDEWRIFRRMNGVDVAG